jgi:hypothetical protein
MRITALFLIVFCAYTCKKNVQEKETEFEWGKLGLDKIKVEGNPFTSVYLGGGLCIEKYPPMRLDEEWSIGIYSCYDSLSVDTVAPIENVLKYRQGGLCFYHDCSIEPEKSFTAYMDMPIGFIESRAYRVFASRYSDSAMLYEYNDPKRFGFHDSILIKDVEKVLKLVENIKLEPVQPHKEEHIRAHNRQTPFVLFKKYDKFWEKLFSMAKPLKTESDYLKEKFYLSGRCNLEFCSTKDILNPLYEVNCYYGFDSKRLNCPRFNREIEPKCLYALDYISRNYDILMHNGAFPAGDCDLGNWRYIKIDSLSVEHSKKLKELLSLDDIQTDAKMQNSSNLEKQ